MGFFSKIVRSVTKPFKKIIKSPLGKAALIGGLGYLATPGTGAMWNPAGKGQWWKGLLMGSPGTSPMGPGSEGTKGIIGGLKAGWGKMSPTAKALTIAGGVGGVTAASSKRAEEEEPSWAGDSGRGHQDYLRARKLWDWGGEEPMFSVSQGGRVGAQAGMYAGQGLGSLQGAEAGMSQVNQPANQGILEQASMTTDQGQSEDSELIMLIQQLAAMGIPLEQLRGRTKEELVEMMVYLSSQAQRETGEVEEVVTAAEGGRVGLDLGGPLERNPGANEIFLDQSTEVLRGGQDGDSIVEETENIEMASTDRYGNEGDADEHSFRLFNKPFKKLNPMELEEFWEEMERLQNKFSSTAPQGTQMAAQGGLMRTGYALGQPVIPSKDGMQLDMRDSGGYQPHGAKEKKDDVRALLAQGEFVMTSDAVRGLGGGNREVGAKKMYDMMHNLEAMA